MIAIAAMSCLVSSWIMSHLGRNPVSGGSPARDNKVSRSIALSAGVFVHVVISVGSFKVFIEFSVRNTAVVIMAYR